MKGIFEFGFSIFESGAAVALPWPWLSVGYEEPPHGGK
jgi:hypothetical protein